MEKEGEKLKKQLKGAGIEINEAAARLEMTRQNLGYHFRKEPVDRNFKEKLFSAYPEIFTNVKLGEMITTGEKDSRLEEKNPFTNVKSLNPNTVKIGEIENDNENSPFIDLGNGQYIMVVPVVPIKAQAGYIRHYNDEQYIAENFTDKHTFAVSRVYRGKYMAFIVDGDSMDDGTSEAIIEGSTVTGREIQKHHWTNKFHIHRYKDYVIVHEDGIFTKRIVKHDTEGGTIICHSLNTNKDIYPDFELKLDDCYQIFNIVNVTQTR